MGERMPAAKNSHSDDRCLSAGITRQDHSALANAYDRYAKEVYRAALRVLGNPAGAEAIVEAVFLDLWKSPPACIRAPRSLRSWLVGEVAVRGLSLARDPLHEARAERSGPVEEG
jgi:RNA polymerase sigma-70 factor (ECF subfamily)